MPRFSSFTFVLLHFCLIVHAQSHPLSARQPAPPELIEILDDDIFYGTSAGYSYETFPGHEPTTMPYGGLFDDPFLSRTGSQSQSTPSTASTTSSTATHTTKQTQATPTPTSEPPHMTSSSSTAGPAATAFSPPGTPTDAEVVPHSDAKQWKIIGLVVICITFIGVSTLAIVFFDAWWGFLRAVICRRRYGQEREDMVPDWEKRSWEYKIPIPNEDRYIATGSMDNLTANAAGIGSGAGRIRGGAGQTPDYLPNLHPLPTGRIPSPQPMYVQEIDRHPLEPLVRRPSKSPQSPYVCTAPYT
ncbi:hypothetical protein H2248_001208 [Termitomyces sp. 'cryptogamus']|nr:hypothetical protein H2248_001208 [Termitomyces sp. 'cryptogamus']